MTVWYTARGAGLAAVILLTGATTLGTLMSGRLPASPSARVVMQYLHRAVASTALAVLGLHVTMILADSFAHVGVLGALVPLRSGYRPLWVGLGTLATYLVLLVAATGFLRRRMATSPRTAALWRSIHLASYGAWGMAMLHGIKSGTDSGLPWVRWMYVGCGIAVAGSICARAIAGPRTVTRPRSVGQPARHAAVAR